MICRAIPCDGKAPYIFVSYCQEDKATVFPIIEQMAIDSYRIWYDDGNHADNDAVDIIENHLEDSNLVVAFISENFSMSHICKHEIICAIKCRKKIIPIQIDHATLPKGLRMQLTQLNCTYLTNFPSIRIMLNKIYSVEECQVCKAPLGTILLKDSHIDNIELEEDSLDELKTIYIRPKIKIRKKKLSSLIKKRDYIDSDSISDIPETRDSEQTIISSQYEHCDEESTVYDSPNEKTVIDSIALDNDVTVRASNHNIALLLHPAKQRAYIIKTPQVKIGRSPIKCDVVIEGNDSISKLHAEIRQYNQKYVLIDSNSANGTFINGEPLESGKQAPLDNPSVFRLYDESLILIYGVMAKKLISNGSVSLLMNKAHTSVKLMNSDTLLLNRSNQWPDGTLSDPKIHRNIDGRGHALLSQREDGIYLIDDSPSYGNGTHLNGRRLKHSESCLLSNGDQIRLGDTTLEFVSITI